MEHRLRSRVRCNVLDYANIDFITFEFEPSFNKIGQVWIYADEDAFIYKKGAEGAEKINGLEWDEDYEAWTFKTRELGAYVISDVELDEKTVTEDKDDTTTDDGKVPTPTPVGKLRLPPYEFAAQTRGPISMSFTDAKLPVQTLRVLS